LGCTLNVHGKTPMKVSAHLFASV